ncbi:MAG: DNRLRE domain-containing protein, partial [Candidatus Eremiobacteraeota bacterium]|nr:DNRLRE domain-containing protein [Candidatus Eremiobacteraeota bacterium]
TPRTVLYSTAEYYRAYFHFKLPDLKKRYIIKATFSDTHTNAFAKSSLDYCLNEMGPAASNWMSEPPGSTDMVGGKFKSAYAPSLASGLDVTSTVKDWIDGSIPNNGFVLRGKLETSSYSGPVFIYCVWQLDKNAKLTLVHS